jgi:3-phenylpropionate/trans-cinnamate dioxygenase ferredoxin reductase subunit
MADGSSTIVVVGASLAGVRTAQALRREGHEGRIVLVGEETHWPPFDRPPLSKQVLVGAWEPDQARLRVPDPFDVELLLGRRATALDTAAAQVHLDDGSSLAYDGAVLATGAAPIRLPGTEGIDGVHVLRTVDDCLALRHDLEQRPRRVAIVGAGVIGCEVASSCRTLGLEVTVVEALDVPLLRVLGHDMGRVAIDLHEAHGVELRLGVGVERIEGDGGVERLHLADGSVVDADVVVVGIGVRPATGWLVGSGLTIDDGVVCDASCVATTGDVAPVLAVGDVCRWDHPLFGRSMRVEHWTNANDQATHAARVLVHGAEAAGPFDAVPYFWTDQHGAKFQLVGTSAADEVTVAEGSVGDGRFVAAYVRAGTVVGALCVNWPARMIPWRKVIEGRSPAGTLPG